MSQKFISGATIPPYSHPSGCGSLPNYDCSVTGLCGKIVKASMIELQRMPQNQHATVRVHNPRYRVTTRARCHLNPILAAPARGNSSGDHGASPYLAPTSFNSRNLTVIFPSSRHAKVRGKHGQWYELAQCCKRVAVHGDRWLEKSHRECG
jgi:hypothetical protein